MWLSSGDHSFKLAMTSPGLRNQHRNIKIDHWVPYHWEWNPSSVDINKQCSRDCSQSSETFCSGLLFQVTSSVSSTSYYH